MVGGQTTPFTREGAGETLARQMSSNHDADRQGASRLSLFDGILLARSRSTAAMTLILAQACPDRSGAEIMNEVLRIRSRAWPNLRIVELGDKLLGRGGDLISSVPIAYRLQLQRRPELAEIFIKDGRAREVQNARSGRHDRPTAWANRRQRFSNSGA